MEKELAELRERLAKVEEWKRRKQEIDEELNRVWVEGGDELAPPAYVATATAAASAVAREAEDLESGRDEGEDEDGDVSPTSRR